MSPVDKNYSTQEATNKSDKLPALQFYPGDWKKDPGIQSLTFEERGIWLEILFLMHDAEDRGFLTVAGKPLSNERLAICLGVDKQKITSTITTLVDLGVASVRESDGALYNRRMVRDEEIRRKKTAAGKKGGNPLFSKGQANPYYKQTDNQGDNQQDNQSHKQKITPSSSSSSSSSTTYINRDIINNISKEIPESPKPKRKNASPKYKDFSPTDFALPDSWGEKATSALYRWVVFKAKAGHACLLESYQEQVARFDRDPRQFVALVERAIRNGWRGLNEQIPFGKDTPLSSNGFSAAHNHNLELIRKAEEELGND